MVVCVMGATDSVASIMKRLSEIDKLLVIFEDGADASLADTVPDNARVIAGGDDEKLLKRLSKRKISVITCGGAKDSISYTSNSEDDIVVSVQREIESHNGRKYEPFEVPLQKLTGESEYSAMAYVAVKTLLGK
ncbi:MAG: hypothetical protein ACI4KH_05605 [Oscillospiraceae bacterium]